MTFYNVTKIHTESVNDDIKLLHKMLQTTIKCGEFFIWKVCSRTK